MSYTFVRVINNNAIVGADRKGEEVILLGKGIGVRCIKHRRYIVASSLIEKVFVVEKKANERYVEELIKSIPFPYIDTVNKVVALAERLLNYNFKDSCFLRCWIIFHSPCEDCRLMRISRIRCYRKFGSFIRRNMTLHSRRWN